MDEERRRGSYEKTGTHSLKEDVDKGIKCLHSLPIKQMKELLCYYFDWKGSVNMAKQALKEALMAVMDGNNNNVASN